MQDELDKVKTKVEIHVSSLTCNKFASVETKVVELNQIICNYYFKDELLDIILSIKDIQMRSLYNRNTTI